MEFNALKKETRILNPMEDFKPKTIPSEIRWDPLTGRTARICHFMKLRWDKPDFEKLTAGTEKYCPFCPERVMEVTPLFPEDLIPEGRLVSGDRVLFPNIAPYDSLSAVATLGERHYIPMTQFDAGRIASGFELAMAFFKKIDETGHPESVFHVINWNYMPVAGSSLIHPHLQVFVTADAPNLMQQELQKARSYLDRTGNNYWDDLVAAEKKSGDRYLGTLGRTAWFSHYAPMGVAGDVLAVTDGVSSTLELTPQDIDDLAVGLTRAMAAYDRIGIYSFNMNFFTGAVGDPATRFHLLFSPRTFFNQALGTPDIGAIRNLFNESLCMAFPEEIAEMLRPDFQ